MEITLAGGVSVDLATSEDLERHQRRIAELVNPERKGHYRRIDGSAASRAAPVLVDLGRPPMGMWWFVQWVLLTGDSPIGATVANVTAGVFAGGLPSPAALAVGPPATGFAVQDCILSGGNSGLGIPTVTTVPDKSVVFETENLYAIFTGSGLAAGAAFYRATAGVIEVPARNETLFW